MFDPFSHPGCRWKFIREAAPRARRESDRRCKSGVSYIYGRRRVFCECACGVRRDVFVEDVIRTLRSPSATAGCGSPACAANYRAAQRELAKSFGDALEIAREMVQAGLMAASHAAEFEKYVKTRASGVAREHAKTERVEREQREMDAIDD